MQTTSSFSVITTTTTIAISISTSTKQVNGKKTMHRQTPITSSLYLFWQCSLYLIAYLNNMKIKVLVMTTKLFILTLSFSCRYHTNHTHSTSHTFSEFLEWQSDIDCNKHQRANYRHSRWVYYKTMAGVIRWMDLRVMPCAMTLYLQRFVVKCDATGALVQVPLHKHCRLHHHTVCSANNDNNFRFALLLIYNSVHMKLLHASC